MATADALKSKAKEYKIQLSTTTMFGIAAAAGLTAQTIVYPLDVARRRMQLQAVHTTASTEVMADTTWMAMRQIVQKEGFQSLFSGIIPTYGE